MIEYIYVPYYADSVYEDMHPIGFYRTKASAYKAIKAELWRGHEECTEDRRGIGKLAGRTFDKYRPSWSIIRDEVQE